MPSHQNKCPMNFDSLPSFEKYLKNKINGVNLANVEYKFTVAKMVEGDWFSVPIIINSYNRKSYLEVMVNYLKSRNYTNIYIIDNKSTYQPLLDYYEEEKLNVFYLSENVGHLSLWQTSIFSLFVDEYYVFTDSDVVPSNQSPNNFMEVFAGLLKTYTFLDKVGFSLEIEDLPNEYVNTKSIKQHESKFWVYDIDDRFYFSAIDTTFALYRPNRRGGWWLNAGRTKMPFVAKHLPWYEDPKMLTKEDIFYYQNIDKSTHWSVLHKTYNPLKKLMKYLLRIMNKIDRSL